MGWSDRDIEFRRSVLFGLVGSWAGVTLQLDILEPFATGLFFTILSVVCLLIAFYYARKSQDIPI